MEADPKPAAASWGTALRVALAPELLEAAAPHDKSGASHFGELRLMLVGRGLEVQAKLSIGREADPRIKALEHKQVEVLAKRLVMLQERCGGSLGEGFADVPAIPSHAGAQPELPFVAAGARRLRGASALPSLGGRLAAAKVHSVASSMTSDALVLLEDVLRLGFRAIRRWAVLLDLLRRRGRKGSSSRSRLGQLDQGVPASSGLSERGTLVAPDAPAAHKQGGHEGLVARSHEPAPLVLGKSASSAGWSDSTACAEQPVSGGARGTDEDGQSSRDPRARRARRSPRATPSETSGSSLVSSETGSSGLAIAAQGANVQDALMRTLE
ncbi:unnamed protein product, partial [Prorocentrum cordatum]